MLLTRESVLRRGVEMFHRDSLAWGLKLGHALALAALPVGFLLIMIAMVRYFYAFLWITAEDSIIEWGQFFMLLGASLVFGWLGAWYLRTGQSKVIGLGYLLVALAVFFVAGEEIAWGQRILGLATPQPLEAINTQQEITFHNISWAHAIFINAVMLCGMYGTILPFARWLFQGEQRSALSYLIIPPLCLVPAFFMPFGYRLARLMLPLEEWFPHLVFPITKISEVTELCLYFGVLVFAWLSFRRVYQKDTAYHRMLGGIENR